MGGDSLRYAMLTVALLSSPSILLFLLAARQLPKDLEHGALQQGSRNAAV
jgi:hypothetical protein